MVGITLEFLVKSTIIESSSSLISVRLRLSKVFVVAVSPLSLRGVLLVARGMLAPGIVLLIISSGGLVGFIVVFDWSVPFLSRILFSTVLFLVFALALTFFPLVRFLFIFGIFQVFEKLLSHVVHLVLVRAWDLHDQRSHFDAPLSSWHIGKIVFQSFLTLNAAIGYLANFVAIKLLPLLIIESFEKIKDVDWIDKINEGITHIAAVFEIDWQVEEVILVLGLSIDGLQEHLLGILIWDVSDHNWSTRILTVRNVRQVQIEICQCRLYRVWVPL